MVRPALTKYVEEFIELDDGTELCITAKGSGNKKAEDLTGVRFGRLVGVKYAGRDHKDKPFWWVSCDCGAVKAVRKGGLKDGSVRSCGCLARDMGIQGNGGKKTHGLSSHPMYSSWKSMRERCTQPNHPRYDNYGGVGIVVCDRWAEDFNNFYDDMIDTWFPGATIDRYHNDIGYSPANCRWVTHADQSRNRRSRKEVKAFRQRRLEGESANRRRKRRST